MKKVHTPDMVAHLWAHKSQLEAKNPCNNFYFYGDTIYSYGSHFPIACHATDKHGKPCILFTNRGYSPTTERHKATVRYAIEGLGLPVLFCKNPRDAEKYNLIALELDCDAALQKVQKARKKELYMPALKAAFENRNAYAAAMVKGARARPLPEDIEKAAADIEKRKTRERLAEVKKRLAGYKERLARYESEYGPVDTWPEKWRAGEQVPPRWDWEQALRLQEVCKRPSAYPATEIAAPCLLRCAGDDVVTSYGATVPLDHAHKAFSLIMKVQERGKPWAYDASSYSVGRVGLFKIDTIAVGGPVKAGCHTLTLQEVRHFGQAMGWEA